MECIICFHNIRWYQQKTLRCGHTFHRKCLNIWLKKKETCPICRTNIKSHINPYKEKNKTTIMYASNSGD